MEAINQAGIPVVSYPGSDGGYVQEENSNLHLNYAPTPSEKEKIGPLNASIRESRLTAFEYWDVYGSETKRTIEPMGLYMKRYAWYVWGYCRVRTDFRIFRLFRISRLQTLPETFVRRTMTLEELETRRESEGRPVPFQVDLRFHPAVKTRVS